MLRRIGFLSVVVFACAFGARAYGDEPDEAKNKVLILGASRVEGDPPEYESFRYPLWQMLVEADARFDFIGTRDDPFDYPPVGGEEFDSDHEGRGGWTSGDIRENLKIWLDEAGAPDFVLFSAPGGNDFLEGLPLPEIKSNLTQIIEILQAANPDVTILIEKMAPTHSEEMGGMWNALLLTVAHKIATDLAAEKSTPRAQVIVVDMVSGFTDAHLADDVHYNKAGAEFVAERYFRALMPLLSK